MTFFTYSSKLSLLPIYPHFLSSSGSKQNKISYSHPKVTLLMVKHCQTPGEERPSPSAMSSLLHHSGAEHGSCFSPSSCLCYIPLKKQRKKTQQLYFSTNSSSRAAITAILFKAYHRQFFLQQFPLPQGLGTAGSSPLPGSQVSAGEEHLLVSHSTCSYSHGFLTNTH